MHSTHCCCFYFYRYSWRERPIYAQSTNLLSLIQQQFNDIGFVLCTKSGKCKKMFEWNWEFVVGCYYLFHTFVLYVRVVCVHVIWNWIDSIHTIIMSEEHGMYNINWIHFTSTSNHIYMVYNKNFLIRLVKTATTCVLCYILLHIMYKCDELVSTTMYLLYVSVLYHLYGAQINL